MHCFPGGAEMAQRAVAMGLHIGVNGIVSFRNAQVLREAACAVPRDRLLIETDCPYLAPAPRRGKRNEPAYVKHVCKHLAEALGDEAEHLAAVTTAAAQRLFALPA